MANSAAPPIPPVVLAGSQFFDAVGLAPTVLFMAMIGAAAGLIFHSPGGGHMRISSLLFVYTVVSAAAVTVMANMPGMAWMTPITPPAALLLAFFSQALVPAASEALVSRIKRLSGGAP